MRSLKHSVRKRVGAWLLIACLAPLALTKVAHVHDDAHSVAAAGVVVTPSGAEDCPLCTFLLSPLPQIVIPALFVLFAVCCVLLAIVREWRMQCIHPTARGRAPPIFRLL